MGDLGLCPQRSPGAEPLVRRSEAKWIRERSHPEAETLFAFGRSMDTANFPSFLKLGNSKIRFFGCF